MAVALVNTSLPSPSPTSSETMHSSLASPIDFDLQFFNEVSDDFTIESSTEDASSPGRKVSFDDQVNVIASTSPLDVLDDASQMTLWYSIVELDLFRSEARELCRSIRANCTQGPDSLVCSFPANTNQRGLEQRTCLERQRRKYLTLKCVVRGQHGLDEDSLAKLSLRCSKWATELAHEEASRDFVHAYFDDEEQGQDGTCVKRTSDEIAETRRVRPRLAFPA